MGFHNFCRINIIWFYSYSVEDTKNLYFLLQLRLHSRSYYTDNNSLKPHVFLCLKVKQEKQVLCLKKNAFFSFC